MGLRPLVQQAMQNRRLSRRECRLESRGELLGMLDANAETAEGPLGHAPPAEGRSVCLKELERRRDRGLADSRQLNAVRPWVWLREKSPG
jgi:hypothetical protein